MLQFVDNPIPDKPGLKMKYLSPEEMQKRIDSKGITVEDQLKNIPQLEKGKKLSMLAQKVKDQDKDNKAALQH